MRRAAAVSVVLVLAVVAAVLALRGPRVAVELLQVDVADGVILDAALHLPEATPAPALLLAHGFGSDRTALAEEARAYAAEGYAVLTWSARGFGASGGVVGLADPDREIADVSRLVDLLADRPEVQQDGDGDPRVGIAGGSYGGGTALLAAIDEPRLDAVVAAAAWHRLSGALAPNRAGAQVAADVSGVWKAQWASILFTAGAVGFDPAAPTPAATPAAVPGADPVAAGCGRFDAELCAAYARTAVTGRLEPADAAMLDRRSPAGRLGAVDAPTLLISGQEDTLFGPEESLRSAREIAAGGLGAPLAVRWIGGDHGEASRIDGQDARDWLDAHLRGGAHDLPAFAWTDATSGTPQPADVLPASAAEAPRDRLLVLSPSADGRLAEGAGEPGSLPILRPPGGLPAALSTLPGLGDLGGLLPSVDLPGQSAAFTSDPLPEDVTLLGGGTLRVGISVAAGDPVLFVKLHDVSPGGQARLLGAAVNPTRLADGGGGDGGVVDLPLEPLAHRIPAGNRLRLTLATTDQAYAHGTDAALLQIDVDGAELRLPTTERVLGPALPTAVRIALPVLLLIALAVAAAWATRRHERRLAAAAPDPDPEPLVVRGLVKRYADGKVAVDGIDLVVGRGQVVGLLGPNGAGKTTTMRMLLGLIHPTAGEVRLLGHPLTPGHPVLQRVGVLVEGPGFAPYLTGRQNLRSWWEAGGRRWADADVDRALAVADLGVALDRPVRTYSHGMRQRLAIAQALLGRPELLVLDEPTDGLDPEQIRGMRQLLARLGEEGLSILVSSHLLAEVEQMCTHVVVVRAGTVVAAGPVAELVGATRTMVVQVDDRDAARAALAGLLPDDALDVEGWGLAIRLDGVDPAAVVATLVGAGIAVSAATPRGRLEDAFLELTGGDA